MNGNYYAIDIWGLIAALVMVAIAAGISETMRMGVGRTLLWSACRALLQLCAMGFIMEYVIRSNNPWLVLLLVAFMLIAAVQITLSRAKGVPKGLAGPVFLSLVVTMLIMISLVTELIIRPQPWYAPQLVVPLTGMLLGNTVSALAVGLSRFFESMKERRDEVDTLLALGATHVGGGTSKYRLVDPSGIAAHHRVARLRRHCDGAGHDGRSDHRRRQPHRRSEIPVHDSRHHRGAYAAGGQHHHADGL